MTHQSPTMQMWQSLSEYCNPNSASYRPPDRTQCDYMDAIDRQAARDQIDGLKIVRHRLQQAASAARTRVDGGEDIAKEIEATLEDLCISERIAKLEEETA